MLISPLFSLCLSFSALGIATPGPVQKLDFAYGAVSEEQPVNRIKGSTWYGKVNLAQDFKYTVAGCQKFADVIFNDVFNRIVEIERSTDKIEAAHDRFFGSSGTALFALFTHPGSKFGWVGSLPKELGQDTVKSLIPKMSPLLFNAVGGPQQIQRMQVHAEERVYLTFEPENKPRQLTVIPTTYSLNAVNGSVAARRK